MKDSAGTKQDESTSPVARPTWRFSGRRGTPVHLREQAPQTLPPEIRKAVTQLARERAGESAPAADAKPVRATSDLKLGRQERQAPPVAAAPLPVERRNRDAAEPAVQTSHIPAATAPIAEPTLETLAPEPAAPVAEPADVVAAEASATPADAAAVTDTPVAGDATPSAKPSKLTAAERKRIAKAKAKAKAKAQRSAKKDSDGAAAAERARRLFARGRDVDANAAAVIEPAVEPVPIAETPNLDAPLPPDVSDLPDVIPSIDAIDETEPASFPTLEPAASTDASTAAEAPPERDAELAVPTSIADVDLGAGATLEPATVDADVESPAMEPALATETAAQAAWELGRLPFLLQDPAAASPDPVEPARPAAIWDTAASDEPKVEPIEALAPAAPQRTKLQPIDWLPVGTRPTPAPIELDMPRRTAPDSIQRLGAPLEVPRDTHSLARAGARDGMTADARATEARRRISRRRAELDDLVASLAGLGSGRRDA